MSKCINRCWCIFWHAGPLIMALSLLIMDGWKKSVAGFRASLPDLKFSLLLTKVCLPSGLLSKPPFKSPLNTPVYNWKCPLLPLSLPNHTHFSISPYSCPSALARPLRRLHWCNKSGEREERERERERRGERREGERDRLRAALSLSSLEPLRARFEITTSPSPCIHPLDHG